MDEKFLFEYDHVIARKKTENSIRAESFEDGVEEGRKQGGKNKQIDYWKRTLISILSLNALNY